MTATAPAAAITPEKISQREHGGKTEQAAARIARQISAGTLRPRQELPASATLAARWGTSPSTAHRARKLLAAHGTLKHRNRRYHVA